MKFEDFPGGPVVGFPRFRHRGYGFDPSLGSSACWGALKKLKKKKFFFSKVYNKTCENIIWVRAESLLCGHWCGDREEGWAPSHLREQTHLSCFVSPSLCMTTANPQSLLFWNAGLHFYSALYRWGEEPTKTRILMQPEVIWWTYLLQNCLHPDDMCKVRHIFIQVGRENALEPDSRVDSNSLRE